MLPQKDNSVERVNAGIRYAPYPEKLDQNIVNLRGINPQQSAGLSSPVPTSYKNPLLDQDAGPPLVNKLHSKKLKTTVMLSEDFMEQKTYYSAVKYHVSFL